MMQSASEHMLDLNMTLYSDEARCLSSLNESAVGEKGEPYFCRRNFIRAACAVIEGAIFCMKDAAPDIFNSSGRILSEAERAILREESFRLNDKGQPTIRTSFPRITSNIRFAFAMYARAHDLDYALNVADTGWGTFKEAVNILAID